MPLPPLRRFSVQAIADYKLCFLVIGELLYCCVQFSADDKAENVNRYNFNVFGKIHFQTDRAALSLTAQDEAAVLVILRPAAKNIPPCELTYL